MFKQKIQFNKRELVFAFLLIPGLASAFWPFSKNATATNSSDVIQKETVQNLKVFETGKILSRGQEITGQISGNLNNNSTSFQVDETIKDSIGSNSSENTADNAIYTVQKGDSIYTIADYFNVSAKTILAFNHKDTITVHVGEVLEIPPTSGVLYTIDKGDTLNSIAKKYNIDPNDIALVAGLLLSDDLIQGEEIFLPNAVPLVVENTIGTKTKTTKGKKTNINIKTGVLTKNGKQWSNGDTAHLNTTFAISKYSSLPKYSGYYIMPSPGATRTQKMHGHNGVDFANSLGTPILASASGVVSVAKTGGYNYGYGNYIIITHPNGTETVYGHLLSVKVSVGQSVSQGQQIGQLGSTGDSTGPHVHFEIHGAYNPWAW